MNKGMLAIIAAAAVSAIKSVKAGSKSELPEIPQLIMYNRLLRKIEGMFGKFSPSPTVYKHEIEFRISKPNTDPEEVWGFNHLDMKGIFGNILESLEDSIDTYMDEYGYTDFTEEDTLSEFLDSVVRHMLSGTVLKFEFDIKKSMIDKGWVDTHTFLDKINNEDWTNWHLESIDEYFGYTQAYNLEQIMEHELRDLSAWQVEDYKSSNAVDNEDGTFEFMGDTFTEDELDDIDENDIIEYMVEEKLNEYRSSCVTAMEKKVFIEEYCPAAMYPFSLHNEYRDEEQFANFLECRINHGIEAEGLLTIYSLNSGHFDFDTHYDEFRDLLRFFVPENYYTESRIFIYNAETSIIKPKQIQTVRRY